MDPAFLVYIPPLYGSGELSTEEDEKLGDRPVDDDEDTENISVDTQKTLESYNKCIDNKNSEKRSPYKLMSSVEELASTVLEKPVVYESKEARMHLQQSPSDLRKSRTKIEEIQMIDSNILDEIKFADEDDDEKH